MKIMQALTLTTTITLLAASLLLVSAAPMQHTAFAQNDGQGMNMMVTAEEGSNTITVTGTMVRTLPTDITFTVTSPDGLNIVDIAQVTPKDGEFATEFVISPRWNADGPYMITAAGDVAADTSLYKISLPVTVVGGMAKSTAEFDGNLESLVTYDPTMNTHVPAGITIDAAAEIGSDTIMITGTTDILIVDITLTVTDPNGKIVTIGQATPDMDGNYETTIVTGGAMWKEDGTYTVMAQQNDDPLYTTSTEVDIADGVVVPEFGAIAAMILAVAVVSIIAVSARSRLSIVTGH